MAGQIGVVSPERIAMEMRRMLVSPRRAEAVRLLLGTGLAAAVLPEIVPADARAEQRLARSLEMLARLESAITVTPSPPAPLQTGEGREQTPGFPLALGTLLHTMVDVAAAAAVGRRWRLSNSETDRVAWLVARQASLRNARAMRWSELQPLLIHEGACDLLALEEAGNLGSPDAAYCQQLLNQPPELLNPPPLVTGDDLLLHGVPTGPQYRFLLQRVRAAQLDGQIGTKQEALQLVDRLVGIK